MGLVSGALEPAQYGILQSLALLAAAISSLLLQDYSSAYQRAGAALLPNPGAVLAVLPPMVVVMLTLDGDGHWWIPPANVLLGGPGRPTRRRTKRCALLPARRFEDQFGNATTIVTTAL